MIAGLLCLSAPLAAQVGSRAGLIEAERQTKAKALKTVEESRWTAAAHSARVQKIFDTFAVGKDGFRLRVGGLPPGTGFAMGPEYRHTFENQAAVFRASARGSLGHAYLADAEFSLPRLAGRRMFADFYAVRSDYPRLLYYGPGPSSVPAGVANYRLENTAFESNAGVKPFAHLKMGVSGGYLVYHVGPGQSHKFVSAEEVYNQVPGMERQTTFVRAGPFLQLDYRDHAEAPSKGGNYLVRYVTYSDRDLRQFSFTRIEGELQQYIPFFNQRRIIAFRAKSVLSEPHNGQFVPFYLQPSLGGSYDLRGFSAFRFYDNNSLVLNGEYRFDLFTGVRLAIFADAGKVSARWRQLNFSGLKKDYGLGLRSNLRNSSAIRLDCAFSSEGAHVWLAFDNAF
jgi:outer membrane protein assembly factor BamA